MEKDEKIGKFYDKYQTEIINILGFFFTIKICIVDILFYENKFYN